MNKLQEEAINEAISKYQKKIDIYNNKISKSNDPGMRALNRSYQYEAEKSMGILQHIVSLSEPKPKHDDMSSIIERLSPTKDQAVAHGYNKAKYEGYNFRKVLKNQDDDIYFSGWMDCHEWMTSL